MFGSTPSYCSGFCKVFHVSWLLLEPHLVSKTETKFLCTQPLDVVFGLHMSTIVKYCRFADYRSSAGFCKLIYDRRAASLR